MFEQDSDRWVRELREAGWTSRGMTIWISPSGLWFRGPFGAWKAMQAGAK
jgi:hypothetical protein